LSNEAFGARNPTQSCCYRVLLQPEPSACREQSREVSAFVEPVSPG
jgi:hypothetical protein